MPFKPTERLYRSFAASNFHPVERDSTISEDGNAVPAEEPSYKVRGYYSVWNSEYELYPAMPSAGLPAEYERVDPHAIDNADLSDVLFQENHTGSPLARIKNGSLTLGTDEHGAWCEAYLGGCQRGRDLYESIVNGLITEMSFGFTIADDDDGFGAVTTRDEQGNYHTTLTRIDKIYDVSGVSLAASPYTEISEMRSRSAVGAQIDAERRAAEQAEEDARAAEEQRAAEQAEQERAEAERLEMLKLRAKAIKVQSI